MTEPLWGVGSTPPSGPDGRSINLREVILRHGGVSLPARTIFAAAAETEQATVIEFLESLVLFAPPDTASNLDPGDRTHPEHLLRKQGSIDLSVLFNDPTDKE